MKKLVLLVILGTAVTASVWRFTRGGDEPAAANRLVVDRIWIDHVPRGERDMINIFVAISEEAVGVFQTTSLWRGAYEAFRYEAHGGELRVVFPQNGDRETVRTKAKRCSEQGMDFCLELDGASRGVKKYYSREGWEIDRAADLDAIKRRVETVRAELEASN